MESETGEIDGSEAVKNRGGFVKMMMMMGFLILLWVFLFVEGERGGESNGANREVEEEEEDCGGEPAGHG